MLIIIGYILTILNYVCYCSSRFLKEKKNMLALDLVAKILTIISFYCLGSLSGAYSFMVAFVIIIVANIKERKGFNKFFIWAFFILFQLCYIIIFFVSFDGLSTVLICVSSSISLVMNWFFKPQKMRLISLPTSVMYLGYQLSIKNWAGLLELFVIMSNLLSYVKYRKLNEEKVV